MKQKLYQIEVANPQLMKFMICDMNELHNIYFNQINDAFLQGIYCVISGDCIEWALLHFAEWPQNDAIGL